MEKLMTNNNSPKDQQHLIKQLAQQIFCANDTYKSLTNDAQIPKKSDNFTVVFNDIVQLVNGNKQAELIKRTPLIINKINTDLSLRKLYQQLIKQLRFAESGIQVAASTGQMLSERNTEHFSLKFKRDNTHPRQVYVILNINNPAEHHFNHEISLHITTSEQVDCLYFPTLIDGRSQLLMEDNDCHLKLLTDNNSHLYLI